MIGLPTDPAETQLTGSLEDYLETILELVQEHSFARVRDIAKARSVKSGSVSPALRRLAELGLVKYVRREYVALTPEGEQQARRVTTRHRLLARFFSEVLGMPAATAQRDACAMEHSLSDEGMDCFVRFFEYLSACPQSGPEFLARFRRCSLVHEDVAPCELSCGVNLVRKKSAGRKTMSVEDLKLGQSGKIVHVGSQGAIRQRLLDMGLLPDVLVRLERMAPGGGPVWIQVHGSQIALRRIEARSVLVSAQ